LATKRNRVWKSEKALSSGDMIMLNYNLAQMRYEPYPLVVLRPALDAAIYSELARNYPSTDLFGKVPNYDYKLSLSEKFNSGKYAAFIAGNEPWNRFHSLLKSDDFLKQTVEFLKQSNIDLGLDGAFEPTGRRIGRATSALLHGKLPNIAPKLRTRFEFSVLKAVGGEVAPHTDTPKKVITLVLSMIQDGEWVRSNANRTMMMDKKHRVCKNKERKT